jgi:type II secretory pathway pseudopilin PulG
MTISIATIRAAAANRAAVTNRTAVTNHAAATNRAAATNGAAVVPGWRGLGGGFTLVELMISILLVLLLILGINEVFRLTSQTISAGQAVSTALRDQRAARQVFDADLSNAAPDAPYFIIRNQVVSTFRSRDDELTALNPAQPWQVDNNADGDGTDPGELRVPALPGPRMYRVDSITFFTRNQLRRQTGNINGRLTGGELDYRDLVGFSASGEALVNIGHLRQPNNQATPTYYDPGEANRSSTDRNDNNRYATQWLLGRNQTLLVPFLRDSRGSTGHPGETAFAARAGTNLQPLAMNTAVVAKSTYDPGQGVGLDYTAGSGNVALGTAASNTNATFPWESTQDVAVTTLADFAQRLSTYRAQAGYNLEDPAAGRFTPDVWPWFMPAVSNVTPEHYGPNNTVPATLLYRYHTFPFAVRNVNTIGTVLAQTSPVLLPRVTQHIVEYAGDFLKQDANGKITGIEADGQLDFVVFRGQRRIRWYGLPRYTGSGNVETTPASPNSYVGPRVQGTDALTITGDAAPNGSNRMPDVVPLSDVIMSFRGSTNRDGASDNYAAFERIIMPRDPINRTATRANQWLDPQDNYANITPANMSSGTVDELTLPRALYVCAWVGGGPKLIRITLTLEDPSPRNLSAGQTYEYVYTLPY